jgi:PAS domain S-box-containing protein
LRESEAKFRQLSDNITDVFWITSPDLKLMHYVSAAYEVIWGRSMVSLYADPHQWIEAILPEDRERVTSVFGTLMANAPDVSVEYRIARPDGAIRWVHDRGFQVRDAAGSLVRLIGIASDITERKQTETALRESNEKFHQLADNITDAFWISSPDMSEVQYVSSAFETIWGRSVESLYADPHQWTDFILPDDRVRVLSAFASLTGDTPSLDIEYRIVRPEGEVRWIRARGYQVRDAAHKLIRHTGIISDITERKRFESQLLQSQRMETVGKLAGGIAHEFNSILTAILGQSELLLGDLPAGSALAKNATEIIQAASRAAVLTRQLLAYGRKQILQPEILDLNRVLASMKGVFDHLMGGGVDTQIVPCVDLSAVQADAGQIEQVIVNMSINARDAMPNGGKLTLETANITFDQESVGRYPELKPGDYVMLAITDTGVGMSEEVKARVFEPFFSTKEVGQGTGLGLSTCYGIVKQSGGHISVYSELGRGATFKIYLPQVEQQTKTPAPRLSAPDLPRGTETILLVEDDPALREMAGTLLRRLGYTVLVAANGVEALSLKQQRGVGHIDLLFTDVVMPHMSGKELAERVRILYPHTRILFTSAYTENAIVHQGVLDKGVALLQKPFTPSALAHKLRKVLDHPGAPSPETTPNTSDTTHIQHALNTP